MKVVNVKVKYIRPLGYSNLKDWLKDPENVYIGRKGIVFVEGCRFPVSSSPFANPFKVGKDGTRAEVIIKYEKDLRKRLLKSAKLRKALEELKGKRLGCWCHPEACHGDVLLKLLNEKD
jgi:hypothetical protein